MVWDLAGIPDSLKALCQSQLAAYQQAADEAGLRFQLDTNTAKFIAELVSKSEWFAQSIKRYPAWLVDLIESDDIWQAPSEFIYRQRLQALLADIDESQLYTKLRQFRHREMLRILWRDLLGWADLPETLRSLSSLADVLIHETLICLHRKACDAQGLQNIPLMLVVALGKLGGQELNFSSDVDLLFAYPDSLSLEHPEVFYTKIAQQLINALHRITDMGFVFRVDMRLRPFGESGALVLSHTAMGQYYQEQGRDWERYALMKARVISGNDADRGQLLQTLKQFVYRPYVDYAMLSAVRQMKNLVAAEVQRKQLKDNIKLGPGGIREIEFIVQSLQLIRGGKLPALQQSHLLSALNQLKAFGYLPDATVTQLQDSYCFLRQLENKIQMLRDQQTHDLPKDENSQAKICYAMGYENWQALLKRLAEVRHQVSQSFASLLLPEQQDTVEPVAISVPALDQSAMTALLTEFWQRYSEQSLSEIAKARLQALLPLLQKAAMSTPEPLQAMSAVLKLLEGLLGRSAYFMLMLENPSVLEPLLAILVKSPWLAQLLRQHPALLESLCDANGLAQPLEGQPLRQALLQQLQNIPANDQEKQMENLRQFKWSQLFRIAIADLQHRLPLMRVSDHLSDLAIALLEQVERNAWQQVSTRYRLPDNLIDHGFAIVAYGKLGGIELSYSSDLDLVFLYQESSAMQVNKAISSSEFYWKLAQKMLSLLQTKTYSGALYEIDLRLRPSGNAGLLVSELTAYADYQLNQAWTWEHQALLRARMVVGSEAMRQQFTLLRRQVLCQPRDPELLRKAVVDMRDKMRISHPETKANVLKQGRGGLIDIEFLVQYLALRYAATYPELVVYPDNIRILEACAKVNVLSAVESAQLIDIYKQLRQLVHYQFMQVPAASDNPEARAAVALLWQKYLA